MTSEEIKLMALVNKMDRRDEMVRYIKENAGFSKKESRLFEIFVLEMENRHTNQKQYIKAARERASNEDIPSNYFTNLWKHLVAKVKLLDREAGDLFYFIPWQLLELKKLINEIEAKRQANDSGMFFITKHNKFPNQLKYLFRKYDVSFLEEALRKLSVSNGEGTEATIKCIEDLTENNIGSLSREATNIIIATLSWMENNQVLTDEEFKKLVTKAEEIYDNLKK